MGETRELTTGRKLELLRRRDGLSQKAAGARFGMSASSVSLFENDVYSPRVNLLTEILGTYGVTLHQFASDEFWAGFTAASESEQEVG